MSDAYLTISDTAQGLVREKMSRFISFAIPVDSHERAREVIAEYTNRYHDARHVCWAYRVGHNPTEQLSNDNGEPSGTAGRPILGQITSAQLTDTLVLVVRYFGGIKLGTSGLIQAYKEAAREAIEAAEVVEKRLMTTLAFRFPYLSMQYVMKIVKRPEITVLSQSFDNLCSMEITFPRDLTEEIHSRLSGVPSLSINE